MPQSSKPIEKPNNIAQRLDHAWLLIPHFLFHAGLLLVKKTVAGPASEEVPARRASRHGHERPATDIKLGRPLDEQRGPQDLARCEKSSPPSHPTISLKTRRRAVYAHRITKSRTFTPSMKKDPVAMTPAAPRSRGESRNTARRGYAGACWPTSRRSRRRPRDTLRGPSSVRVFW